MTDMEQAQNLFKRSVSLAREELNVILDQAAEGVRKLFYKLKKDSFFVPENRMGDPKIYTSSSGKYRLEVHKYRTGEGTWGYTQGLMYQGDRLIAEVRRNYYEFPFIFVEGHPKGDFLICGEDYQRQTVVDLVTGKRKNSEGDTFCWAEYKYSPEWQALLVAGCYWAAPYEYRVYDFSDPMCTGWPHLELMKEDGDEGYADCDEKWPSIEGDLITFFQSEEPPDDVEEDPDPNTLPVASQTTYRREGTKLSFVETVISEAETERRRISKVNAEKWEQFWKEFRATDPLYLAYIELVKDPALSPADSEGIGWTYKGWFEDPECEEPKENRLTRRIVTKGTWVIDLEWGVKEGPVKLVLYRDGKKLEEKFFPEHSVESLNAAVAYAKGVTR